MLEAAVVNEIIISLLAGCRARGIDTTALLRASPLSARPLKDRWGETPWNVFIDLLERIQDTLGSSEGLNRLAGSLVSASRVLRFVGHLVADPRALYATAAERMARRLTRNVGARLYPRSDGRIGFDAGLPEGSRPSLPLWHALTGVLRGLPTAMGLGEARVEVEMEPLRARFAITPPSTRGLPRLANRLKVPLRGLVPRSEEPTASDIQQVAELALNDSAAADIAATVGPRLASHADGAAFGAEVTAVMKELFCCTHVVLWSYQSNGQQVLLFRERGQPGDRMTRILHLDRRPVGRIEVDVVGLDRPSNPTFDAILPWIALGMRWTRAAAATARNTAAHADRFRSFAERWNLTERQREVLALLIEGVSNREIADSLETSVKNVEIHVTNLLARAGVENRSRLISRFWQAGG